MDDDLPADINEQLLRLVASDIGGEPPTESLYPDWPSRQLPTIDPDLPQLAPKNQIVMQEDINKLYNAGFRFDKKPIGGGAYGVVWGCVFWDRKAGLKCRLAAKRVSLYREKDWQGGKKVEDIIERIQREMDICQILTLNQHQHIVQTAIILRFYYENRFPHPYNNLIFTEMCSGDLVDLCLKFVGKTTGLGKQERQGLPKNDIKKILLQISNAIHFLHSYPKVPIRGERPVDMVIAHCDIKPDNIFVKLDGIGGAIFKLGDFGLSIRFDPAKEPIAAMYHQGTPYYMAPEIAQPNTWGPNGYDPRCVDVYALGASALALFIGFARPRANQFIGPVLDTLKLGDLDKIRNDVGISRHFRSFLAGACNKDPKQRYTVERMMADPWLAHVNAWGYTELEVLNRNKNQQGQCNIQ